MSGSFENVGWCKPGFVNVYNICMMEELHTVLSLGAGGVTKLVKGGVVRRLANPKYPQEYLRNMGAIQVGKGRLFLVRPHQTGNFFSCFPRFVTLFLDVPGRRH